MKKIIIFLLIIICSMQIVQSQSGWFWQNPLPTGSHLEDVFFVNESVGYAVGWNGTIIKTTNSGLNWIQLNSGVNLFLYSVYFINNETGYVVSGDAGFPTNSVILKTTNGGQGWNYQNFANISFNSIYFVNSNTGYAAGIYNYSTGILFKTTNGGMNWVQVTNIPPSFFTSIFFLNDSYGYIANDQSIIKTTNGGQNWVMLGGNILAGIQSIYFNNNDTGFAVGYYGKIYKTWNGGVNWNILNSGTTTHLWSVKFKNNSTGYIVGGGTLQNISGKFLKTTNGGNSWDTLNYGSNQNLVGLAILNDTTLLSVGYWGTVIRSTNSGNNFFFVNQSISYCDFRKIKFINSITGFIIGSNSSIFKSINGGNNWSFINSGTNYDFNDIEINDVNNIFICCNNGKIINSTNGGNNWVTLNSGTTLDLLSLDFVNQNTGYVVGEKFYYPPRGYASNILKTTNSGFSWSIIYNTNNILQSCYFLNENTGFVFTGSLSDGKILKTNDGGQTWNLKDIPVNSVLNCFHFLNNLTGFAGGRRYGQLESYSLLKTTNCGENWFSIDIMVPYEFDINSIFFTSSNVGYLASVSYPDFGRAGDIFKTIDGGNNWYHYTVALTYPTYQRIGLNSIYFLNNNTGFVIGEKGSILKTIDEGGLFGINQISNYIPVKYNLSQNYPNPFNPVTKIRFEIPFVGTVPRTVRLIVYDLLGREVTTLVNEKLKPGTYEIEFDGSSFASGVYFYKLITDEFSQTNKMILIK